MPTQERISVAVETFAVTVPALRRASCRAGRGDKTPAPAELCANFRSSAVTPAAEAEAVCERRPLVLCRLAGGEDYVPTASGACAAGTLVCLEAHELPVHPRPKHLGQRAWRHWVCCRPRWWSTRTIRKQGAATSSRPSASSTSPRSRRLS
jgi:hypothetical protein